MTKTDSLPVLLLRTYPKWWRDRYHDEMEVMIQSLVGAGRPPLLVALNLLKSSLSARLLGIGAPATRDFWATRTQRSLLVSLLPWFVIVPLTIVFALSNSENGFFHGTTTVRFSGASMDALDFQRVALYVFVASFIVAFVGWRRLRNGLEGQRVQMMWFHVVNRLAMVSIALVIAAMLLSELTAMSLIAQICVTLGLGLFAFSWLSMPKAIVMMLRDGRLSAAHLRSEVTVSIVMAILSAVTTLLVAGYLFAISLQPIPLPGASYLMYRSTLGAWNGALLFGYVVLSLTSALGSFAARQSYVRVRAL